MNWERLANAYISLGDNFLPISQLGGEEAHQSLEIIAAIEQHEDLGVDPSLCPCFIFFWQSARANAKTSATRYMQSSD